MNVIIQWCNQNQGFAATMLTVIYVIATLGMVWMMIRANKLTARNTDVVIELERERTRPVVMAEIYVEGLFVYLRIRNMGLTTARRIRITTDPKLKICLGGKKSLPAKEIENEIRFIREGIASLPPAGQIMTILGTFDSLKNFYPALRFAGSVEYTGGGGRTYNESFDIDLSVYQDLLHRSQKGVHDIATTLEELKREIGLVVTGFHKPLIRTQDEKEHQKIQEELMNQAIAALEKKKDEEPKAEGAV